MSHELESVTVCPLCSGPDLRRAPAELPAPYGLVECPACGGIFLSPRVPASRGAEFYTEEMPEREVAGLNPRQVERAARHLRRLQRIIRPPGKLLEVGASDGYFCAAARDAGWTVSGMDLSAGMIRMAKRLFGLDILHARIEDAPFAAGSLDAICLFQVIEHIHAPREFLARVHALLRPGGVLLLSSPNILAHPRKRRRTGKPLSSGLNLPRHVTFYTPRTLLHLVASSGFTPLSRQLRWAAALEQRFGWRPWPQGQSGSRHAWLRDWLSPFGLFLAARKE